jgi:hypothetical protein
MAKIKSAKPNTEKQGHTKITALYPDLFFFKEHPLPYAYIERLMQEWRGEWIQKAKSLRIDQFWNEKGISTKYLTGWKEKYPEVQETYDYIKRCLADKRDIGAITKEFDGNQIRYTFWKYEEGEKEHLEWKAKLAQKEDGAFRGNVVVEMTDLRKSKEEDVE